MIKVKASTTADIVASLQSGILRIQGFKPLNCNYVDLALGPVANAFPHKSFPLGAVHEFVTHLSNDQASTAGFIAGLIAPIISNTGTGMWISSCRTLFPPALKFFGIEPDRFIFIDVKKERDVLWAVEEALKCGALSAVVGELPDVNFTASRRLQLAVEKSQVTGFILRPERKNLKATAFVSRWRITSIPSSGGDLPGVGFPQWKVELLRIRNGRPGVWHIQWANGGFHPVISFNTQQADDVEYPSKKTG